MNNITTSKRVAENTVIQYLRLVVNVLIGLYSVRIILEALGAEDYGLYDVIGGIISILGFVSSSLSQTSLRFLSVALGKNILDEVRKVFNDCFWLHLFIGFFLFILIEVVGLFVFNGILTIPEDRYFAVQCVYQCMAFSLLFNISMTPFSALIIAHEKFYYAAFVSILDSLLKLGIAFLLFYTTSDKLILYAVLMTIVVILNFILYTWYLINNYSSDIYIYRPILLRIKRVSSFAGWTTLDVIGSLSTRQGYAIMLNHFYGPILNASFAIARQIEGNIFTISASVIDTMKPQILKSYGLNDIERMFRLSMTAGKLGFAMMSVIAIPLIIMMPNILNLWLTDVPAYTVSISRIIIIASLIEQLTRGLVYSCQATGNIKWFSIFISLCRFSALPISILLFFFNFHVISAFYVFLLCESLGSISRIYILSRLTNFKIKSFILNVILRIIPVFIFSTIFSWYMFYLDDSILFVVINILLSTLLFACLMFLFGFNEIEKETIKNIFDNFRMKFF